jgi:hypothetical protein
MSAWSGAGPPVGGRSVDALLGPIGEPYLHALCTKWQIDRYGWEGGDYVNQPLDLQSFAWRMNLTEPQALDLDEKMVRTFRPAIEALFE